MIEFIQTFINASIKVIQDLLPDRNSNTVSWVIRLFVLTWILFSLLFFGYYILTTTTLGKRYGVEAIIQPDLPKLSHLELALSSRDTWVNLTQLREGTKEIKGVFLVMLYNKKTGNFITYKPTISNNDVLIWEWSILDERFTTLEIVEDALNQAKPRYIELLSKDNKCHSNTVSETTKKILQRGVPEVLSTHFTACPIYTKDKGFLVGAVVAFSTPNKETTISVIEDRVRRSTNLIAGDFKSFTTRYEFIYE